MEIIFKCDRYLFFIESDKLKYRNIEDCIHIDKLNTIRHLADAEVLYHYYNTRSGDYYPVYYEYGATCITKDPIGYNWRFIYSWDTKDYTFKNLKLIE